MHAGGTLSTAFLRALYVGLAVFAAAALADYGQARILADAAARLSVAEAIERAIYTGLSAAAASTVVRGLIEGMVDSRRQIDGDIKASDVQPAGSGTP